MKKKLVLAMAATMAITSCAVPFFFVLSGYFYGKEYQQGRLSGYKCGRLIKKYLKMYLFWGGIRHSADYS